MMALQVRRLAVLMCLLSGIASSGAVGAQETYPSKPVRMIIPFAPGGGADVVGRLIASRLADQLGQNVIVDNRTGAGGVIGTEMVARAAPDGHTLGFVPASFTMQPSLRKLPYDPVKSFVPVARVGKGSFVLVVTRAVPADTLQGLIDYAKRAEEQLAGMSTRPIVRRPIGRQGWQRGE